MKYLKLPFKKDSFPEEFTILCLLSSTEQSSLDEVWGSCWVFFFSSNISPVSMCTGSEADGTK